VERQNGQLPTESQNVLLLATEKKVYGFDLLETFRVAIGRHDSNDLRFNSRNVSNYHAEILIELDGLVLHDLGSTNGTYVTKAGAAAKAQPRRPDPHWQQRDQGEAHGRGRQEASPSARYPQGEFGREEAPSKVLPSRSS
jgi:hypothetical protein